MAIVTTIGTNPDNGIAPYIGSLGYSPVPFPFTVPLPGGINSTVNGVLAADQVARWEANPPAPGAQLLSWGLSDQIQTGSGGVPGTRFYDFAPSESGDFVIVLVDENDLFVPATSVAYSGDMIDYSLSSVFPTDSPGLLLRSDDSDEEIGYFEATITPVTAVGYHVELLAFALSGAVSLNTSVIFLRWETEPVTDGWVVGQVAFPGGSAGFS